MTALELERLYAEEWPDGTFGGLRPAQPRHRADLETAISRTRRKATT